MRPKQRDWETLTLERRLPGREHRPSPLPGARVRGRPGSTGAPQRARHSPRANRCPPGHLPPEPASPPAASALTQAQQPGSGRRRQDGPGQRGPHREGAAARLPQAVAGPRQHYRLRPPHRYPPHPCHPCAPPRGRGWGCSGDSPERGGAPVLARDPRTVCACAAPCCRVLGKGTFPRRPRRRMQKTKC